MEQNTPDKRKSKIAIIVSICLLLLVIFLIFNFSRSCSSSSSKIEVVEEPKMTMVIGSLACYPRVSAKVKNKSNSTIDVQLSCSIYDSEGNVTDNITSIFMTLAPGETTTLVAESYYGCEFYEYSTQCASFGNVEYKFL